MMSSLKELTPAKRMLGVKKTLLRMINDMADPTCLNLGLGEPAFPTPDSLRKLIKENIDKWHLGYSPNAGLLELRELIAESSRGSFPPDQVCVTSGSEEALFLTLASIIEQGDEILIPDPGFPTYASITRFFKGIPVGYELLWQEKFHLKSDRLIPLVTDRTKAVVINSPHNPTGKIAEEKELKELSGYLEAKGIAVVSDDVYAGLEFDKSAVSPSRFFQTCFTLGSLSKTYSMTGWRLGWVICPREWIDALTGLHQMMMICASVPAQRVAIEALKGHAHQEIKANKIELRRRRDLALECLKNHTDLPFIEPQGAFYIMVDIRDKISDGTTTLDIALEILKKVRVVVIPGSAFGPGGEGFLRISFAPNSTIVQEGIKRIGHFFSSKKDKSR